MLLVLSSTVRSASYGVYVSSFCLIAFPHNYLYDDTVIAYGAHAADSMALMLLVLSSIVRSISERCGCFSFLFECNCSQLSIW